MTCRTYHSLLILYIVLCTSDIVYDIFMIEKCNYSVEIIWSRLILFINNQSIQYTHYYRISEILYVIRFNIKRPKKEYSTYHKIRNVVELFDMNNISSKRSHSDIYNNDGNGPNEIYDNYQRDDDMPLEGHAGSIIDVHN